MFARRIDSNNYLDLDFLKTKLINYQFEIKQN